MRAAALLLVVAAAAAGGGNGSCDQRCGAMELPYPFGFSGGCAIQLGCDDGVGSAWLGATRDLGLLVRNVTRRALIVALRPDCSRPFNASVAALFSDSYAPASGNTLVVSSCSRGSSDAAHLRNCSSEPPDRYMNKTSSRCGTNESIRCILPLPPSNASGVHPRTNASIRGHHFLTKSEVLRSNCAGLVSAVSYSDAQGPSLLLGALELDWWVPGLCRCAHGADCTRFTAPTTGREAFRCECREGFEGDGFVDGAGCRKVSKCDPSKYPSGVCGKKVLVGLLMAGIIFGAMVMALSCVVCHLLKRRSASIRSQQSTKRLLSAADCTVPLYSYREIERATSGFSEDQRLGTGAYGTVYAGRLSDNRLVAVKRIKHRGDTAADGLGCVMNEVKLVSSVSHRNLVRLLGCCIDQGHQILVYEFMPNGTLAQHLQRERGRAAVPWTVRLRIAAETAKAVAYLHSEVHPPIYHRDIKSSNILLDHDYNSKVADFGLSRMGMASDVDSSHISTAPQGTPGYVDPQYHQNFHLSDKSDVYSFGVVLVEIITAMKVVDFSRAPNEINLAQLAVEKIGRGCVDEIVDPFLDPHRDAWTLTSIHKVAELAFRCLAFHSEIRPSMAEVADELEQIQVSGWAPSTDDAAFMSTTSSLCSSSAPSRGPDKSRGEALSSTPVIAVVAQETEKGAVGSSPVSVHERWFSDRSSPSSSSLLANSSSLH